jgi:hypothetical protein
VSVAVMAFGAIDTGAWFTDTASTSNVTLRKPLVWRLSSYLS